MSLAPQPTSSLLQPDVASILPINFSNTVAAFLSIDFRVWLSLSTRPSVCGRSGVVLIGFTYNIL